MSVLPARAEDIGPLATCLARAFDDDPVTAWVYPNARSRAKWSGRFFQWQLRRLLPQDVTWTTDEAARYPMTSTFEAGIALVDVNVWDKPVPLGSTWPNTEGAKTNPNALWYGAVVRIAGSDFALIAGTGSEAAADTRPLRRAPPCAETPACRRG